MMLDLIRSAYIEGITTPQIISVRAREFVGGGWTFLSEQCSHRRRTLGVRHIPARMAHGQEGDDWRHEVERLDVPAKGPHRLEA